MTTVLAKKDNGTNSCFVLKMQKDVGIIQHYVPVQEQTLPVLIQKCQNIFLCIFIQSDSRVFLVREVLQSPEL